MQLMMAIALLLAVAFVAAFVGMGIVAFLAWFAGGQV